MDMHSDQKATRNRTAGSAMISGKQNHRPNRKVVMVIRVVMTQNVQSIRRFLVWNLTSLLPASRSQRRSQ
jgi:hypothetical protein